MAVGETPSNIHQFPLPEHAVSEATNKLLDIVRTGFG